MYACIHGNTQKGTWNLQAPLDPGVEALVDAWWSWVVAWSAASFLWFSIADFFLFVSSRMSSHCLCQPNTHRQNPFTQPILSNVLITLHLTAVMRFFSKAEFKSILTPSPTQFEHRAITLIADPFAVVCRTEVILNRQGLLCLQLRPMGRATDSSCSCGAVPIMFVYVRKHISVTGCWIFLLLVVMCKTDLK